MNVFDILSTVSFLAATVCLLAFFASFDLVYLFLVLWFSLQTLAWEKVKKLEKEK